MVIVQLLHGMKGCGQIFLNLENQSWAIEFRREMDRTMRQPRTSEEKKRLEDGEKIPPFAPFVKATFGSKHNSIKRTGLSQMKKFFGDEWVVEYLFEAMESADDKTRAMAIEKDGFKIVCTSTISSRQLPFVC